ncbi:sulfatase-like hydrolase/transferase [Bacillus sp. ISL-46]|uniref:sulfatase-like hydrolase/transferase n=1 Tax=Bacillus sp. ISL-46 TaxID=2819129 RepID=UPI001BECEBBA|nr:sulfatase-like hydrolase/transferase [Bacillus sp. ISL-46]MBT2720568.1 sulfatase-like hydrolase/transferase [Bacillus sp. ISL-46]
MVNNYTSTKPIMKALALGSMLTLTATMTACSSNISFAKTSEKPKENTKKVLKNPTQYANGDKKPNIVYIVLDDIGFSDLGTYGSEIKTPNIDKLAADGLRYNNFNATALCSPTRASLLTGRENNSVGMGLVANVSLGPDRPNLQGGVTPAAGTVTKILKENSFSTFGVGKWHIAPIHTVRPAGPFDYWPLSNGSIDIMAIWMAKQASSNHSW